MKVIDKVNLWLIGLAASAISIFMPLNSVQAATPVSDDPETENFRRTENSNVGLLPVHALSKSVSIANNMLHHSGVRADSTERQKISGGGNDEPEVAPDLMLKNVTTLGILVGIIQSGTFDPAQVNSQIKGLNFSSFSKEREVLQEAFVACKGVEGYRAILATAAKINGQNAERINNASEEDLLSNNEFKNILIQAALTDKGVNAAVNKVLYGYRSQLTEVVLEYKPTQQQIEAMGINLNWRDRINIAESMPAQIKAEMIRALDFLYNNPQGQLELLQMQAAFGQKKINIDYIDGASTAAGLNIKIGGNTFKHKYLREDGTYVAASMPHVLAHEISHVIRAERLEDKTCEHTNASMQRFAGMEIPAEWKEDLTKPRVGQIFYNAVASEGKEQNAMQAKITGVNILVAELVTASSGGYSLVEQREFLTKAQGLEVKLEITADHANVVIPKIQRHEREMAAVQVNCNGPKRVTQMTL